MWETFRDFVAAIAGLCDQSCDPKVSCCFLAVLSLIPQFCCGCCRILFKWANCGNISAVSLQLLPVFCSQLLGKTWEYFCGFVVAAAEPNHGW